MYSLNNGSTRSAGTYSNPNCTASSISPATGIQIFWRILDNLGTTGTSSALNYLYDITPPTGGSFTINSGTTYTSGTNVNFIITCATDTGVSGIQLAYGTSANPTNWTACTPSVAVTLPSSEGTKTGYITFKDALGNITTDITDTIILDTLDPIVQLIT